MINYNPKLFVIVGSPASGKDELIKAINTLGSLHADIVPKHTDRNWKYDDGDEMICKHIPDKSGRYIINPKFNLDRCNIIYENYKTKYGVDTNDIWNGLKKGIHQVLVVSNVEALNSLKDIFGNLAIYIYIYSEVTKDKYIENEIKKIDYKNSINNSDYFDYLKLREENFDMAWKLYEDNFMLFNHVFIFTNREEDLYDQIFRLFRYYENRR